MIKKTTISGSLDTIILRKGFEPVKDIPDEIYMEGENIKIEIHITPEFKHVNVEITEREPA